MRKISYSKIYSPEFKVVAKMDANNVASIFVNDKFKQQICEDNLVNNIERKLDSYVLENIVDWESEETIWEVENSPKVDIPFGARITWLRKRNGENIQTFSLAGRTFEYEGIICRPDWGKILYEEWKKRYHD